MALKATLDTLDGLSDLIKAEYKKGEDGKFHLDVDGIEGHPDVGALKRAKDAEVTSNKELRKKVTDLSDERDGLLKGAIPKADVERLENSYKEKLKNRETELTTLIKSKDTALEGLLVDNVATQIATEISSAPKLLIPVIRARLKAEFVDGRGMTRVLDATGGLSASSTEDLKKELLANKEYAPILIGSKASGSNTQSDAKKSSAPAGKTLAEMSPTELSAHLAANKQS